MKNKSFSLTEVSVVLLILGILLTTTLSFKSIINQAKIAKIATRLNEYSNSMAIFYNTYQNWPGNLTEEQCMKYNNFSKYKIENNLYSICKANISGKTTFTQYSCDKCKYTSASENIASDISAVLFLNMEGLISNKKNLTSNALSDINDTYDKIKLYYEEFEEDVFITIGSRQKIFGERYEFQVTNDSQLYKNYYKKNQVTLFNANKDISKSYGALSSEMAEQLDLKIDDGKPHTGMIIASKPFAVQNLPYNGSESQSGFCTNILLSNNIKIDNAEYSKYKSDDKKYGCNITLKASDFSY
jgi:Tfp pilus assembly protein PilE